MKNNLKSFIFILILGLLSLSAFAFGGKAPQTAVGSIKYFGNAPFAFPGLECVDGYLYTLQVEEGASFTLKDIEEAQGSLIEVTGSIEKSNQLGPNTLKDGVFVVSEWKRLDSQ
ncbi:MAG: hypothetical protein K5873_02615 [Treponema sp.]|nr:hypothetical protein [Treponema sp.]